MQKSSVTFKLPIFSESKSILSEPGSFRCSLVFYPSPHLKPLLEGVWGERESERPCQAACFPRQCKGTSRWARTIPRTSGSRAHSGHGTDISSLISPFSCLKMQSGATSGEVRTTVLPPPPLCTAVMQSNCSPRTTSASPGNLLETRVLQLRPSHCLGNAGDGTWQFKFLKALWVAENHWFRAACSHLVAH